MPQRGERPESYTIDIIVKNNFHNTRVRLRATVSDAGIKLTASQLRRARNALCGIPDCGCGGHVGERGPQEHGARFEPLPDGGAAVRLAAEGQDEPKAAAGDIRS